MSAAVERGLWIDKSLLAGRWYLYRQRREVRPGKYEIVGKKEDVTDVIEQIIRAAKEGVL